MIRPISAFESSGQFSRPKQTPMETWDLVSRFPSRYRHLEFLFHLLIGPIFKTPSWIWKTIESIVLETIAYCLSRLLFGYGSYERALVVTLYLLTPTS